MCPPFKMRTLRFLYGFTSSVQPVVHDLAQADQPKEDVEPDQSIEDTVGEDGVGRGPAGDPHDNQGIQHRQPQPDQLRKIQNDPEQESGDTADQQPLHIYHHPFNYSIQDGEPVVEDVDEIYSLSIRCSFSMGKSRSWETVMFNPVAILCSVFNDGLLV